MASMQPPSPRTRASLLVIALLASVVGLAAPASADWIRNDILLGNGQSSIAPGESLLVLYYVQATGNDRQAGCNAADATPLTVSILPSAPGATATPSHLVFTACSAPQPVVFVGHAPGNYRIDLLALDAGPGTYGVGGATFTLHVAAPEDGGATLPPPDTGAPTWSIAAPSSVEATGPGGALVEYDALASDPSGIASSACSPPSGGLFSLGATTVTCTATDTAGNTASAAFTVTVLDTTPPALLLPADVAREGDTLGGAHVAWSAAAIDLVDGAVATECDVPSGALFPVGATDVTCSATDASGNHASGGFRVTVTDTTPPVLAPLGALSLDATSGAGALASWTAIAHDLVDGALAASCTHTPGSRFALGATTVTCTATDAAGNAASASFTVTVLMRCDGPLSPFKEGKTLFRHGATIPVKCRPSGGSEGVADATIRLTMRQVNGATQTGDVATASTSAADTGNVMRWDPAAQQYVYNLATKDLARGLWELTLDFGGGHTKTVKVGLR